MISEGNMNQIFFSMLSFAIQKEGKNENKYCMSDCRKKGIISPRIVRPESFAIAIPSTLFLENENIISEIDTLRIHDNRHVITIIKKDH